MVPPAGPAGFAAMQHSSNIVMAPLDVNAVLCTAQSPIDRAPLDVAGAA